MSQIYKNTSGSGPLPPTVATQYILDQNSPAIPAANQLEVRGGFTGNDNPIGIQTNNNTAGDKFIYVELTNRVYGTVTTVGNTTQDMIIMDLTGLLGFGVAGSVKIHYEVTAYDSATPSGLGYSIEASARTNGTVTAIISTPDADEDEDTVLEDEADWNVVAVGNTVVLRVTGVTGLTLKWAGVATYVFSGL